jgi:hypothetical protein
VGVRKALKEMKSLFSVRGGLLAAGILCLTAGALAQGSDESSPLGDVARQARAQHGTTPEGNSGKAQAIVDEMQQEAANTAPRGFTTFDAGDYRVLIPFPFILQGREDGGPVLQGSRVGVSDAEVIAGTPMPIPADLSDKDLSDTARQLARGYSQSASCSAVKLGSHKAFRCGLKKLHLLEQEATGSVEFVVASNSLISVMCVSAVDIPKCVTGPRGHQTCGKTHLTREEVQKAKAAKQARLHDEENNAQVCEQTIYPSIQLKEDIETHPVTTTEERAPRPAVTVAATPAPQTATDDSSSTGPTLAEMARQTRQATRGPAPAAFVAADGANTAPAGFQPFALPYCLNPRECSEASVVIPEKAEVISRTNGQHIFKAALDGESVLLYAGPADVNAPYRSLTDPDYIRMRDLANSNGWSRERPESISLQELMIADRAALVTRFRFQRGRNRWWIGERLLIENRGSQFLLGCAAPEEHFADAEVLCTTMVNSLRLP